MEIEESADLVTEVDESLEAAISLERDLQSCLISRVGEIEPGLILLEDGVEHLTEVGRIDLLARDSQSRLVVVELYAQQVRPFGFMIAFQAKADPMHEGEPPAVIAPYDKDVKRAASKAFDRRTGKPVRTSVLRTYREALAQYHMHPESKFHNADYTDVGVTERRHVSALVSIYIGKEANDLEIQYHLGMDEERSITYGAAPAELKRLRSLARARLRRHGLRSVSRAVGCSTSLLSMARAGGRVMSRALALRVLQAVVAESRLPSTEEKMSE